MTRAVIRLLPLVITTIITLLPSAAAAQYIIDLSRTPATATQSVAPGSTVTVSIVNLAPAAAYDISILREVIPVPALEPPGTRAAAKECEALGLAKGLQTATDESEVAKTVAEIEAKRKDCVAGDELRQIDFYLGITRRVENVGTINAGEQVRVTVTRKAATPKIWTLVLTAGARGTWRTLYGVAIGPGHEERFFARPGTSAGEFVITQERADANEDSNLAVIPSAFFQWLPMTRELKNWAIGPTLGLGVKSDRPAFFMGGIVTFNQNLGVVFGVPVYQELKLRGNFASGDLINEALTEDQLHKNVFRFQRVFLAGVFRFGGNPFDSDSGGEADQLTGRSRAESGRRIEPCRSPFCS